MLKLKQNGRRHTKTPFPDKLTESSGSSMQDSPEGRKQKTRTTLVQAFNALFFESPDREIRVGDVIEKAGVGRSTFYEHFTNVYDLQRHAMSHPMTILADAIAGNGNTEALVGLLDHLQENQHRARIILGGPRRQDAARVLTTALGEKLTNYQPKEAVSMPAVLLQLADGALGCIQGWLTGEIWCSKQELAETILITAKTTQEGLLKENT